jgi:hypothetical protein
MCVCVCVCVCVRACVRCCPTFQGAWLLALDKRAEEATVGPRAAERGHAAVEGRALADQRLHLSQR